MRILGMLAAGLALTATPASAQTVAAAAYADGRLWLVTDKGRLFGIREGASEATEEALPGKAIGICASEGQAALTVATGDKLALRRAVGRRWAAPVALPTTGHFVAMACNGGEVTVLTSTEIVRLGTGQPRRTAIQGEPLVGSRVMSALHVAPDGLYLGMNHGEWGGGMVRIDADSGAVTRIERNATGELCDGPLNTQCDPVNGIVADPWAAGCVMVAIGLDHFRSRGRITQVCGNAVERLYFKPAADSIFNTGKPVPEGKEPFATISFYGLARVRESVWAVGYDGLYRWRGRGEPEFVAMPEFRKIGGFQVSFALPDLVLVLTDIRRRASVSGAAPIMVVR